MRWIVPLDIHARFNVQVEAASYADAEAAAAAIVAAHIYGISKKDRAVKLQAANYSAPEQVAPQRVKKINIKVR